ncbi:MAG: NUDIX hydrolase [Candidatus Spyradocola sp.]|jgi:8-oxo-dGTP diphosphatase
MQRNCKYLALGTLQNPRYVVVLSHIEGKILLSRHKQRQTWETQGGHIEQGETPMQAARRELFEESGATAFTLQPLFDYWVGDEETGAGGVVFGAHIDRLDDLPDSEMAEVCAFDALPEALTYPDITPHLFRWAQGK